MEFHLNCELPELKLDLDFRNPVCLLGSCFSDEMDQHFIQCGFHVLSNPFGTVYHPIALSKLIDRSVEENKEIDMVINDDLYFSWDSASVIHGYSRPELEDRVHKARREFKDCLANGSLLVLTLGTAWAYHLKKDDSIVANCHKQPSALFDKKLSEVEYMLETLNSSIHKIRQLNPKLSILLTISPVRHFRDGLVENNQSKARLIELAHQLVKLDGVEYFPSYEIVIDELRDYRYYAKDLVHPNHLAIEYVWNKLKPSVLSPETIERIGQVAKIKAQFKHRPIHMESRSNQERLKKLQQTREELDKRFPGINWK